MNSKEAWLYAAQWGSYMTAGDPGACMYGFDERFQVQSEEHRQDCLDWINKNCVPLADGREDPDEREEDLEQLGELREAIVNATVAREISGPIHVSYELDIGDIPQECIDDCSGPGSADAAVEHWRKKLGFTVDRDRAIECLQGYGAWDAKELAADDDETLARRILWLACGTFSDYQTCGEDAGSSCFCLE